MSESNADGHTSALGSVRLRVHRLSSHWATIEIAAVSFSSDGTESCEPFHQLVRPPFPVPSEIVELTGLSDELLQDAAPARDALRAFHEWLPKEAIGVAHNLPFDLAIIATEEAQLSCELRSRAIDSLAIARALCEFPNHRLVTIGACLGLSDVGQHRALADALVVKNLLIHALKQGLPTACPELFVPGCRQSVWSRGNNLPQS